MNQSLSDQLAQLMESAPVVKERPARGRWKADGTRYTKWDYDIAECIRNVRKCNDSHKLRYCY